MLRTTFYLIFEDNLNIFSGSELQVAFPKKFISLTSDSTSSGSTPFIKLSLAAFNLSSVNVFIKTVY